MNKNGGKQINLRKSRVQCMKFTKIKVKLATVLVVAPTSLILLHILYVSMDSFITLPLGYPSPMCLVMSKPTQPMMATSQRQEWCASGERLSIIS